MGRTDTHTVPPDTIWEAHLEFHQKHEYTRLIKPMGATENKKCQDHRIIRGLFGTTEPNMRVHPPSKPLVAITNKEFLNHGFIQGVHGPVHMAIHAGADKTMDLVEPPN